MRMRADERPRRGIGLTPLVDVVFLLLLFFMLASTFDRFAKIEVGIAGAAPTADAGAVSVLLAVLPGGAFHVNGRPADEADLTETLLAAAGGEDARIIVRPHREAPVQDIVRALELGAGAGAGDVYLVR